MKRILYLLALALICGTLTFGCAPKKVVPTAEQEAGKMEKEAGEGTMEKEAQDDVNIVDEEMTGQDIARTETSDEEAFKEEFSKINDIYFDYDRYEIKKEAQAKLSKLADLLISGGGSVVIEGHCDDRGTNEYNLALGDRRANAAKDFLVASGVSPKKLGIISYGEERPQCTEQKESCWSKNRRAHFRISN